MRFQLYTKAAIKVTHSYQLYADKVLEFCEAVLYFYPFGLAVKPENVEVSKIDEKMSGKRFCDNSLDHLTSEFRNLK